MPSYMYSGDMCAIAACLDYMDSRITIHLQKLFKINFKHIFSSCAVHIVC